MAGAAVGTCYREKGLPQSAQLFNTYTQRHTVDGVTVQHIVRWYPPSPECSPLGTDEPVSSSPLCSPITLHDSVHQLLKLSQRDPNHHTTAQR